MKISEVVCNISLGGFNTFVAQIGGAKAALASLSSGAVAQLAGLADPKTFGQLQGVISTISAEIGSAMVPALRAMTQWLAEIATSPTFGTILKGAQDTVAFLVSAVTPVVKGLGNLFIDLAGEWLGFVDAVLPTGQQILDVMGKITSTIGVSMGGAINLVQDAFRGLLRSVVAIGDALAALWEALRTRSLQPLRDLPAAIKRDWDAMDQAADKRKTQLHGAELKKGAIDLNRFNSGQAPQLMSLTDAWARAQAAVTTTPEQRELANLNLLMRDNNKVLGQIADNTGRPGTPAVGR